MSQMYMIKTVYCTREMIVAFQGFNSWKKKIIMKKKWFPMKHEERESPINCTNISHNLYIDQAF